MNGIIIVNQYVGHNQHKIDRFKEEFAKRNISLDVFTNDGTLAVIKNNEVVVNLPKADFILYLDKDYYLSKLLEKAGYRLFNKTEFTKLCDDKILTFITCSNQGIRMPETFAGPLVYRVPDENYFKFLDKVEKELGFPLVVKKVYGSLGEGVYLVNNHEELVAKYKASISGPVLFQKYIPSSTGRSIRVIIIDGKVFGGFIRTNDGDFRSNFGKTAGGEKLVDSSKYSAFAQDIASKLNIEYAGIDLLDDIDGNPILCEINSNAFFEEFEKITKLNVAEAIRDMIIRKINKDE